MSKKKEANGVLPLGLVHLFGNDGVGKCVTEDTYVMTEYGLITIGELFREYGIEPVIANRDVPAEALLLNENDALEKTSHFTMSGRRDVYKFETYTGNVIRVTPKHRLRVMDDSGFITWRYADSIESGDYLVSPRTESSYHCESISEEEARLLGYLIADGSLLERNSISFSNSDPDVIEDFHNCFRVISNIKINKYEKESSRAVDWKIYSKDLRGSMFERYNLGYVRSSQKTVPLSVRKSGTNIWREFIRAYAECESFVDASRSCIEILSASRQLLLEVKHMLSFFGIVSLIREKNVKGYGIYHRLTMHGDDARRYINRIGFVSSYRHKQSEGINDSNPKNGNTNHDFIPHINRLLELLYQESENRNRETYHQMQNAFSTGNGVSVTYNTLEKALDLFSDQEESIIYRHLEALRDRGHYFDRVVSIEMEEGIPVFDVVMPDTHSFWSNGLISHNTSLALTCGADPQKAAFIDLDSGKSRYIVKQLGWKYYYDVLSEVRGKNEIALHKRVLDIVDSLPDGLDVIVIDNTKEFFNSGDSWFITGGNWKQYRPEIRGTGEIVGGIQWRTLREYHYPAFYSQLTEKAQLAIITSHEKEARDSSGVKTGAMKAAADPSLRKGANLIIRLTQNKTGHPAPVGLVIKNIGVISDDGTIQRVLPPRVDPCTWATIRSYAENPIGNKAFDDLADSERPDEEEQRLIEGSLSPEQERVYRLHQEIARRRMSERMAEAVLETAGRWDGKENKMMYNFIVKELNGDYDLDADDVMEILEAARE